MSTETQKQMLNQILKRALISGHNVSIEPTILDDIEFRTEDV